MLPRWRGAAPIHRAILNGDNTTGISIMKIEEHLDQGPTYMQSAIEIGKKISDKIESKFIILDKEREVVRIVLNQYPCQTTYA